MTDSTAPKATRFSYRIHRNAATAMRKTITAISARWEISEPQVSDTAEFETHAHNMATYLGHPDLKVLVLPYPLEARPAEELREIAVEYYPRFLELLQVGK